VGARDESRAELVKGQMKTKVVILRGDLNIKNATGAWGEGSNCMETDNNNAGHCRRHEKNSWMEG